MAAGRAVAFGLDGLQERAEMFVAPGDEVYEGMIVGENSRSGDMVVNPTKEKKLTNIRAAGRDENILLKPPRILSLEAALEYIEEDELVEVTPAKIRLRKLVLSANAAPPPGPPPRLNRFQGLGRLCRFFIIDPPGTRDSMKSRFQDEDHGMTTDRLTMIFFYAPSHRFSPS